ncbi:CCGSCS motif protein [Shewanella sp. D64]|uniref:CCGSCS motif protein n=1 Tax=unclassified Shewanella TaxID=196818 RepID=UPI0022BA42B0|nr:MULTISPECIES: CCGSCS motif protein [unclassified Shewanella]MEC4724196.1 CCGSCS motif protein [Shewanella sp. D64]MEC4736216.1 CCGSCS motif protein [Shewanella sp. E94]WBJ97851.1 CCGSCS motif protein [Shewanella sp. MTB7]
MLFSFRNMFKKDQTKLTELKSLEAETVNKQVEGEVELKVKKDKHGENGNCCGSCT